MSETAQAFQWVYSACAADTALVAAATGGIFQGFADIGTTAPYVLVVQQSMTDTMTLTGLRLFVRGLFQVKAVGPSKSYATLITIADRIDALFKNARSVALSPSGGILASYREQSLAYEELINGAQWSHLGGLYTIDVQAS